MAAQINALPYGAGGRFAAALLYSLDAISAKSIEHEKYGSDGTVPDLL